MGAQEIYVAGLVAYDGTDYHGYQYQVGVPTIQGALETALSKVATPLGRVVAAGRTDAGVHANGQVVAVRVGWRHDAGQLQRAWNAHLPASICVRRLCEVPEAFHPRFSALWRTYRYRVVQPLHADERSLPDRSPLTDRYSWFVSRILDVPRMQSAADALVGEHDFATFGQPTQGESTVRTVSDARWQVEACTVRTLDPYPGRRLVFTVSANGFLRQMVRTVVGTSVEIGLGRRCPEMLPELLEARDRSLSAPPAPASGLTLERVLYPAEYQYFG